jgi:hypothetical protein
MCHLQEHYLMLIRERFNLVLDSADPSVAPHIVISPPEWSWDVDYIPPGNVVSYQWPTWLTVPPPSYLGPAYAPVVHPSSFPEPRSGPSEEMSSNSYAPAPTTVPRLGIQESNTNRRRRRRLVTGFTRAQFDSMVSSYKSLSSVLLTKLCYRSLTRCWISCCFLASPRPCSSTAFAPVSLCCQ